MSNGRNMREMESVIKRKDGNILARCRAGKVGLILKKTRRNGRVVYSGRALEADDMDCEYRITQLRNGRLSKRRWQSVDPFPIGFLPLDEVKTLLAGGLVSRGCR